MKVDAKNNVNINLIIANRIELLPLTCKSDKFLAEDLLREWKIWSKCFGKVLLINGPSSSGKTTLSKYLSKFGFNTVSSDNIRDDLMFEYANNKFRDSMSLVKTNLTNTEVLKVLYGFKFTENKHQKLEVELIKSFQQVFVYSTLKDTNFLTKIDIFERIYDTAKNFIFSGHNVVIDLAAYDRDIDMLHYSFRYYPITIGFLYSSLEENLMRCFKRNDISSKLSIANYRHPADIIDEYRNFYKFTIKKSNALKLDKIDKDVIRNILEVAVLSQNCLLDNLKYNIMNTEIYSLMSNEIDYESKIRSLLNISAEAIKKSMALEVPKEIYAIPAVKYDFIIKSLRFKADSITAQGKIGNNEVIALQQEGLLIPRTKATYLIEEIDKLLDRQLWYSSNKVLNSKDVEPLLVLYDHQETHVDCIPNTDTYVGVTGNNAFDIVQ